MRAVSRADLKTAELSRLSRQLPSAPNFKVVPNFKANLLDSSDRRLSLVKTFDDGGDSFSDAYSGGHSSITRASNNGRRSADDRNAEQPHRDSIEVAFIPQPDLSDAALQKGGVKRKMNEKRGRKNSAAHAEENIMIVDMKENAGKTFHEIAAAINRKRIADGKVADQTTGSVSQRFARTAPILFEAKGLVFVSLKDRRMKKPMAKHHGTPIGGERKFMEWNDAQDMALVECVDDFEASKWNAVARMLKERVGVEVDAETVAKRWAAL